MNFLSTFEMLDGRLQISLFLALITAAWVGAKLFFWVFGITNRFPKLAVLANMVALPLVIFLTGSLAYQRHSAFGIGDWGEVINALTFLGIVLVLGWSVARFVEIYLLSRHTEDDTNRLPVLQRGLLFSGCLVLAVTAFFNLMEYSVTGFYLSTGAVAAVFAFAMQRTLGDLFSGIALSLERPFRMGDWIELEDGTQGQIIDINWRATRVRGWDNATLTIPNGVLAQQKINNMHGANHIYAQWYEIRLSTDVDPQIAKALLLEAALKCDQLLQKPRPSVRLADISCVPYVYTVWVHFPNFLSMFAGREQLFRAIHRSLADAGIATSPEVRELHTRKVKPAPVQPATTLLTLQQLDIAALLTPQELGDLADTSERHTYEAGAVIIKEGQVTQTLDIVAHGIVETGITTAQGVIQPIDEIGPGQYFGLYSMISDTPSFQQFAAATDVTVIRIHMERIRALLAERPDLQEEFARIVKQRIDAAQQVRQSVQSGTVRLTFQDVLHKIQALVR